ncbi:hypothetical protein B0H15DRAFT_801425 [Mycena belliarum]|uniref:Uncharacterized protein n=1 Tax=Mycena belliarum TaxID=1033014 RepID=A0AAD6XR59_9AGAR|nr:hypothetical protein B0H15DRAFT_801425 [Mycena belliae]
MPEIILRQKFMKLIPPDLHDDLKSLRGISTAYSSLDQMRAHSNQLWDALKTARGNGRLRTTAAARTDNPAKTGTPMRRTTTAAEARPRSTPVINPVQRNPPPRNLSSNPHAEKTCFKCGGLGHLGNNPICPRFSDQPSFKDRPRVGAQRVFDSYPANDEELDQEVDTNPIHDHWGGSQYDEFDYDAVEEPTSGDLAELTNITDSDEPRLSTMRYQYFSMRITAVEENEISTSDVLNLMGDLPYPLHPSRGFSDSAHIDLFILDLHRTQRGLPEYTPAERAAIMTGLRTAHQYPDEPTRDFAQLAHEFEAQHGNDITSQSATDQWDALMKLSAAEQAWHQSQNLLDVNLDPTPEPTAQELRFMTPDDLEQRLVHLKLHTGDLEVMYEEVFQMNHYSRTSLRELRDQISLPRDSSSGAWRALDLARVRLEEIMHSTADVLSVIMNRFDTARPYRIRLRYECSQRPTLQGMIEGPIEVPLEDDADEVEVINLSDGDSMSIGSDADDPIDGLTYSPPSLGSTPPPSYPGTPESDEQGPPPDTDEFHGSEDSLSSEEDWNTADGETQSEEELWGTQPSPSPELFELTDADTTLGPLDIAHRSMRVTNGESDESEAPFGPEAFDRGPSLGATTRFQRELDQDLARAAERQMTFESPFQTESPVLPSVWDRIDQRNQRNLGNWDLSLGSGNDELDSEEYVNSLGPWPYEEDDYSPPQFVHPEDRMIGRSEPNSLIPGTIETPEPDDVDIVPTPEGSDHAVTYIGPTAEPHWDDPCILRSLVIIAGHAPEHYLTFVDRHGTMSKSDL